MIDDPATVELIMAVDCPIVLEADQNRLAPGVNPQDPLAGQIFLIPAQMRKRKLHVGRYPVYQHGSNPIGSYTDFGSFGHFRMILFTVACR